jgi:hypothetical protein
LRNIIEKSYGKNRGNNFMKLKDLETLMAKEKTTELEFKGKCETCGIDTAVLIKVSPDGGVSISGGAVCDIERNLNPETFMVKCDDCYAANPKFGRKTEVWSRVVGYLRPVGQWNQGKRQEFKERKNYDLDKTIREET